MTMIMIVTLKLFLHPFHFTDFYVLHHLTIAQFNLATVSTTENRPIIIAFKINVIKLTSARVTCRCIRIITEKIQRFIKKAFRDIEPQRNVSFSIVFSTASARRTFIVGDANTHSKTKPIWVRLNYV